MDFKFKNYKGKSWDQSTLPKLLESIGAKSLSEAVQKASNKPLPSECPTNDALWDEHRNKVWGLKTKPSSTTVESPRLPYKDDSNEPNDPECPF